MEISHDIGSFRSHGRCGDDHTLDLHRGSADGIKDDGDLCKAVAVFFLAMILKPARVADRYGSPRAAMNVASIASAARSSTLANRWP